MKPPLRPRLAPARYVTGPGEAAAAAAEPGGPRRGQAAAAAAAWSGREKRALLAALRAQAAQRLPELQLRLLRERLPRRSEEEIARFVGRLRGRAAREAVTTRHRLCLEQQRRLRAHPPAPIEVWLELAETLGEGLEEVTAAAFSQVLTVAATEPLNLLHSVPPRPPVLPEGGGGTAVTASPGTPPPPPPAPAPPPGDFPVDFPRLYEFLAQLCRGGRGPPLPPAEAAVLLALLGSLPPQLAALDVAALRRHLRGSYSALRAPRPPPGPPPDTPPADQGWGGVGLCPLNLFLLPLRLLRRPQPAGEGGTPPGGE